PVAPALLPCSTRASASLRAASLPSATALSRATETSTPCRTNPNLPHTHAPLHETPRRLLRCRTTCPQSAQCPVGTNRSPSAPLAASGASVHAPPPAPHKPQPHRSTL